MFLKALPSLFNGSTKNFQPPITSYYYATLIFDSELNPTLKIVRKMLLKKADGGAVVSKASKAKKCVHFIHFSSILY